MTSESTVLYAADNGVATLTLHRPEVYNAFNRQLHTDLRAALKQAECDESVRCVVITGGEGKAFCSGQDLKELPLDGSLSLIDVLDSTYHQLIHQLRSLPKPVVAAVNGVAAGAGFSLALACDFRIAVDSARFVAAFSNIGLVPDSGMTYFLPRLIGQARALELAMLGETIDAATAYQYGLVSRVAPVDEFPAAVREYADRLIQRPAKVLSLIKRGFALSEHAGLDQVLAYEAQAQQIAAEHPDFAEGVTAFREKRSAKFQ